MDNPGSCNTDSFLGNHPNKILIMKPKSDSTHICTKCQRPLEEGGGCYTFCNGKNFLPIPEENPKHPGCRRPLSRISSTLNPNKAMKDILVHYISQERDEDTGLYTDVVYKGYIQHWHCGSGYQMAIILNTEGRFHRTTIDKIWVEKEDMPTTK